MAGAFPRPGHRAVPVSAPHLQTEASRWLSVLEADVMRGLWVDPREGEMKFSEFAERWFSTKIHLRETTQLHYTHPLPVRVKGAATQHLPEMRAATPEKVVAIVSKVEPRWRALILMAAYSGVRWGELAGLRRKYLDPLHKKVRIVEQLLEVNGHLKFSVPKTSDGVRTVALPEFLVEVVVDHIARHSQPGPEGLVFVMPEGTPLRRENFRRRVWYPASTQLG